MPGIGNQMSLEKYSRAYARARAFLFLRQVSETKCRWENIFVRAHVLMRLLFLLAHLLAHSYL